MATVIRISDMTAASSAVADTDWIEISRQNSDLSFSTYRVSVAQIIALASGGSGSSWSFGDGPPTGTGSSGAVYLNKTTGDVYSSNGTQWTLQVNLMGPTGADSRAAAIAMNPCTRPPTKYDDSDSGYRVKDQWQFNGVVYEAQKVDSGAAEWAIVDSSGFPGDVFGSATQFAGGVTRVVSGYTGPAVDVETTVSGAAKSTTINILSNGLLDVSALETLLAASDTGTFATVTKVYDQTANANHLTYAGAKAVHLGAVAVDGQPVMSWGYRNGAGGFSLPASVSTAKNSLFFGQLGRVTSSNSGDGAAPCSVVFGSTASAEVKALQGYYEMDGFTHVVTDNTSEINIECPVRNDPGIYAFYSSATGYSLLSGNELANTPATLPTAALTGGYVGFNASGNTFYSSSRNASQASAFIIANTVPSDSSLSHFRASSNRIMGYSPQVRDCLVTIGDSRTQGYQTFDNQCWPVLIQERRKMAVYNFAVSGSTTTQMLNSLTGVKAIRGYRNKVAVVWGGINDIKGGASATTVVVPNLSNIVRQLQGLGFTVLLMQEAQGDNPPRAALMDAIQKGAVCPDMIADPWVKGKPMYDRSVQPELYFTDYTHPSNGGHQVIAEEVWNYIGGSLAQ